MPPASAVLRENEGHWWRSTVSMQRRSKSRDGPKPALAAAGCPTVRTHKEIHGMLLYVPLSHRSHLMR